MACSCHGAFGAATHVVVTLNSLEEMVDCFSFIGREITLYLILLHSLKFSRLLSLYQYE